VRTETIRFGRLAMWCLAEIALTGLLGAAPAAALPVLPDGRTQIIAMRGEAAPGGGTYDTFNAPTMNNQGQIAFRAELDDIGAGSPYGAFRYDGAQTILIGGPTMTVDGEPIEFLFPPSINELGQVAFWGTVGRFSTEYVLRGAGGPLTQVSFHGQTIPGGGSIAYLPVYQELNDAGQVLMPITFNPGSGLIKGLYRGDGGPLAEIARMGRPADGGSYTDFSDSPALNNAGQVAFVATTAGPGGSFPGSGVYRGDGSTTKTIVREGDLSLDGLGTFGSLQYQTASINNAGLVAFNAYVVPFAGVEPREGLYVGDGNDLTRVIYGGDMTADGKFQFSSAGTPLVNDANQIAFIAYYTEPSSPTGLIQAVYRTDALSYPAVDVPRREIARFGDFPPDGNGRFQDFSSLDMNSEGQLAMMALLSGSSGGESDDRGIYFFSEGSGLVTVAREGQSMLGSTIRYLDISSRRGSLNDLGQISYTFLLRDGRWGIAVWQIPEPSSLVLAGLALLAWLAQGRGLRGGA
jgi:hypothetical protein